MQCFNLLFWEIYDTSAKINKKNRTRDQAISEIRRLDNAEKDLVQCRHLIPALNALADRAKYTTTCPIATFFPGHGCMNDLQLNVTLIRKLRGSLMCLSYFIGMLSMGVCTTRQWQTSDRLVQELNGCTVYGAVYIVVCVCVCVCV